MTALRKLERDFVRADLAAVTSLIAQLGEADLLTRFGLEARRDELQQTIAELDDEPEVPMASAALFFGGAPVIGGRGVESEFAGTAVTKFQDIVSKVLAHEIGGLAQRGVVPHKSASTLHITNVVRGSFGFLFEEIEPQQQLVQTPLKVAVDEATRLLDAFGEPDEEQFQSAVESIDQRILSTAGAFFDLMRSSNATLRLVVGSTDRTFGAEAVARAAERATSTTVEEAEETLSGRLAGVLPDAHQFEFRTTDRGTVRGRVSRSFTPDQLAIFNRELVNVDALARVRLKQVLRNGVIVRETFTLESLTPATPTSNPPPPRA